jgi:hypothetical protein
MKRNILLALALLIAVSCVPVQAAESKSGWTVFKNSAKVLIGSLLIFKCSIKTGIDAITFDKEAAMNVAEQQYQASLAEARANFNGRDLQNRIDLINFADVWNKGMIQGRGTFGIFDLLFTAGGIAFIYSGYKGLTQEEDQRA